MGRRRNFSLPVLAALLAALVAAHGVTRADVVTLNPVKDNTLYKDDFGSLSNGAGQHLFVGTNLTGVVRRGVVAFDIAAGVPAGSTINTVTLSMNMSRTNLGAGPQTIALHRLTGDWGEAGSVGGGLGEGAGAPPEPGDATWLHTFFDTDFWTTQGGDFVAGSSASVTVDTEGVYTWGSTAAMVADVQGWLDTPATSFGWILIGGELAAPTAKRFDTKDNLNPGVHPQLEIDFTPPAGDPAGSVPDGDAVPGVPLLASKSGADLKLDWSDSCRIGDTDYEIYEGTIGGDFTSHGSIFCTTGGATTRTFTPAAASSYYLVVPHNGVNEGSYGTDSAGAERSTGAGQCRPRVLAGCS